MTLRKFPIRLQGLSTEDRFYLYCIPEPNTGCWLWLGFLNRKGYAQGIMESGKLKSPHRWAYEHFVGPIPQGLVIDHLCRVRSCVNPAHMEVVTHRENIFRGVGIAPQRAKQTHCIHGHELSGDNLIPRGRLRQCRQCHRKHSLNWARRTRRFTVKK